jgi:hypothetical protein
MNAKRWITRASVVLCFGCQGDDRDATGNANASGLTTATGTGIDATGGSDDDAIKLDAGAGTSAGTGNAEDAGPSGCTKVDVVISVDNSSSMTEEIEALQGPVFDSFPTTLLDINVGLDDFQLGLIDACPKPAALQDTGNAGACGYSTMRNYMVSSSPDLAGEFSCATELPFMAGWSGGPDVCDDGLDDDEQPALTAATVVSPPFVGDANDGFLRPDALLMAVAITDEDEALVDAADAQEIYDKLVAAKGGDVSRVAFLGIAGGSDCDGAYGSANDAVVAQELAALFEAQGRGMFWDLCQGQLEVAFQTFIEGVVDDACVDFVPEG